MKIAVTLLLLPAMMGAFCCGLIGEAVGFVAPDTQIGEVGEAISAASSGDDEAASEEIAEAILEAAGADVEFGADIDFAQYLGFDMPLPTDATPVMTMAVDEGVVGQYETSLSAAQVTEFYQGELAALGFEQNSEMNFADEGSGMNMIGFTREDVTIAINIISDEADGIYFQIIGSKAQQ